MFREKLDLSLKTKINALLETISSEKKTLESPEEIKRLYDSEIDLGVSSLRESIRLFDRIDCLCTFLTRLGDMYVLSGLRKLEPETLQNILQSKRRESRLPRSKLRGSMLAFLLVLLVCIFLTASRFSPFRYSRNTR